jgi:hypothetical protein
VSGAINIFQDITEQYSMQTSLSELNEELKWYTEELEQMAYCVSHDLREPLRVASMYTQLLERKYKDQLGADGREYVQTAVQSCDRARDLLNDLLTYNRIRGKYSAFEYIDLNKALDHALSALKIDIEKKGAVITREELPPVFGDEHKISLIFQNLIGNAMKFCATTPRVHIFVKDRGREITLGIEDNGIGIDPLYKNKIFEIFERLHSNVDYPGTGIGLAICKKITEQHRGSIWFDSVPGQGTTFYLRLPGQKTSTPFEELYGTSSARATSQALLNTESSARHIVQIYKTSQEYLQNVIQFIATGIEKKEGIVLIVTPEHWKSLERALICKGFNIDWLRTEGRLLFIDAERLLAQLIKDGEARFVDHFTSAVLGVVMDARERFSKFRVFGELVDVLCAKGMMDTAIAIEKVWDNLVEKHKFVLFCAYHAENIKNDRDQSKIVEICQAHTHLLSTHPQTHL